MTWAEQRGVVFDIQRFSLHDGPGVRTTVFLKGCNARCAWCHNPESFRQGPQVRVLLDRCALCGACEAVCPNGAHGIQEGIHSFNSSACGLCGKCVEACPVGLVSIVGEERAAGDVMAVVLRDRIYYESSGGGVTFSGGEPTAQPAFLEALLRLARGAGLHTCLETNGLTEPSLIGELSGLVDLFLLDFKVWDGELHRQYVGALPSRVPETLKLLDGLGGRAILRCPIIPSVNDVPEHFAAIRALRRAYSSVAGVDIMPYHRTGVSKWRNFGFAYTLESIPAATAEQEEAWKALAAD